jgi:hypothetical protein
MQDRSTQTDPIVLFTIKYDGKKLNHGKNDDEIDELVDGVINEYLKEINVKKMASRELIASMALMALEPSIVSDADVSMILDS